jgi:glycosyltransferase involved in cell wall biosynthesis
VSLAVAEYSRARFDLALPVTVVPNAIAMDQLAALADLGAPPGPGPPQVIVPGRLVPEKGHRTLVAALIELRALGHRPEVLIVGDGPLQAEIAVAVRGAGLTGQVTLRPAVPWHELVLLVRAATLLVLPSVREGFPLAPAEAMALGTPVVATAVGGLPELIDDGVSGLLVPPEDPVALARAVARLLNDASLRAGLASAARRRAQDLAPAAIAHALAQVYRDVLS